MMLNEQIISILFRLINFGILLWAAWYMYVKHIRGIAQGDMEADEKKVAILAQQKDAYHQQELFLTQEIQNQHQTITHLIHVLEKWRSSIEHKQHAAQQAHEKREQALRKKAVEQSEHIAEYMLARRALPYAMKELEVSLTDYFSRDKRANNYVSSLVNHLDKDRQ